MYRQFNIQQFYVQPTQCIYVFCVDLRTNSDYFPIQHYLTGFCNRDGVCLLRGTDYMLVNVSQCDSNIYPCHGSVGQSPASYHQDSVSIPGKPVWDLW